VFCVECHALMIYRDLGFFLCPYEIESPAVHRRARESFARKQEGGVYGR
jgi:hypothetical protein